MSGWGWWGTYVLTLSAEIPVCIGVGEERLLRSSCLLRVPVSAGTYPTPHGAERLNDIPKTVLLKGQTWY